MSDKKTLTITTIFMVPLLKIPKDELKSNGFINGYHKDGMLDEQYTNCIYLLFKPQDLEKFRTFLANEYERTKDVINDYDYPDGFVVVVYKLSNKFNDDYELVKQGKYSKTSYDFQQEFPRVVKIMKGGLHRDEIALQYRIFRKTQDLVKFWEDKFDVEFDEDQEVWHGFDDSDETLTKDKLE